MKQKRLGKRIAAWLMCLAMVLTTINLPAFTMEVKAAKITDEIDGINYTFDNTNYTAIVVKKESGYAGDIIIPETVSYDGNEYTVTEIGSRAFYGCTGLTTIEIPDKVEIIYSGAFYNCSGLKNISMPCRLRTLKDLSIPEGVEVTYRHLDGATESCSDVIYSYERFYTGRVWYKMACNGVLNITGFGTGYVSWDDTLDEALSKNEVKEIIISDVYKVDVNAFIDFRNLTSVTIGENIKAIGENAFSGCNKLSSIVIPESVETIGCGVFEGCTGLRSISMPCRFRTAEDLGIPDDVEITYTHVSDEAAASCEEIVDSGITDDGLYYELTCNGTLTISGAGDMSSLKWLGTDIKTVIIEEGVTGIGVMVFQNCSNLSSITIPGTVNDIGYRAFYNCSKLSEIAIPNGVRYIGESTFAECPSLINVTIPDTVESIDDSAFEGCINLGSIYIPDSVTSIRWGAFKNCTSLKNITIPSSVISLGNSVFSGCTSLESITIPNSIASISQSAFEGCTKLSGVTISDGVTSIDSGAFKGCTSLESITIPHSIAIIGYEAFAGCSKLKNVTITNGVQYIETTAFKGCTGLTEITIPNSVREIVLGAFAGCTNINHVTMPCKFATSEIDFGFPDSANITYAHDFFDNGVCVCGYHESCSKGNHDFSNNGTCVCGLTQLKCEVLNSADKTAIVTGVNDGASAEGEIYIPSIVKIDGEDYLVTEIDNDAFYECGFTGNLTIPNSVTTIGNDAFNGCGFDGKLTLGNSVTTIGDDAFSRCGFTGNLTIPDSVTTLGTGVFSCCDDINSVSIPCSMDDIMNLGIDSEKVIQRNHDFSDGATKCKLCDVCKSVAENGNHNFSDGICVSCGLVDELAVFFKTYEGLVTVEHDSEHPWAMQPGDNSSLIPGWYDSYAISSMKITAVKHVVLSFSYSFWNTGDSTVLWVDKNGCNQYQQLNNDNSSYETELQPGEYLLIRFMYQECFDDGVTLGDFSVYQNHDFSVLDTENIKALVSEATCTEAAKYYKSCACGVVSDQEEDIVEVGEPLGHTYENAVLTAKGNVVEAHCGRLVAKVENGEQVQGPCGELLGCATINATAENKVIKTGETTTLQLSVEKGEGYGSETSGLLGELTDCQWYLGEITEEDEVVGTPIEGANESTYQLPTDLTPGTYTYVCVAKCDGCEVKTSVSIVVEQDIEITTQPQSVTATEGTNATFKIVATGTGLNYKWQYSQNNGKSWINSGAASSVTDTYVLGAKASRNGYLIRCIVKDANGQKVVSEAVKLTVKPAGPVIITQPEAVTATEGTNATFKIAVTGTGLTYKWQYSQNNGSTWINSGAASSVTDTYVLGAKASRNGYLIRCTVKDANGETVTSEAVKMTVKPVGPVITTQPEAVTATEGTNATFKIAVTGTGLTYQWQYSQNAGKSWINSGAASSVTDTYVLGAKASRNGYLIRCIVKDANGETVTSEAVKMIVKPAGPVITTQPEAVTVVEGKNATFKIAVTGTGLTYQWQYSQDNGTTWKNSSAASSVTASYVLGAKASRNGYLIRCIITDANGETVTSEAVKMTVKPAGPSITIQPEAVTAVEGKNATFKIAATGTGLTYQWQYSQDNGSIWKNSSAVSSVTDTYVLGAKASRNGYLIRCVVTDANGQTITSEAVKLTVTK